MESKQQKWRNKGAFTLVEVVIAMVILTLTVASSLIAMRTGFSIIESARDNTLASQILQSEMENLRLKSWEKLVVLPDGEFDLEDGFMETVGHRFVCLRTVNKAKPNLIEITLRVEWKSVGGRTMSREYSTFFSKSGLNDYYYRAFH